MRLIASITDTILFHKSGLGPHDIRLLKNAACVGLVQVLKLQLAIIHLSREIWNARPSKDKTRFLSQINIGRSTRIRT